MVTEGAVAMVTGAAQGIGEAVARALTAAGTRVAALDVNAERVERVAAELGAAVAYPCQITDSAAVDDVVARVEADLGPIGLLVNVAGVLCSGPAVAISDDDWARTFAVNTGGVFHLSRAVARRMIPRRSGAIVTVGSNAAGVPRMNMSAYAASKAAAAQFTKCLGLELAPYGIRCNVVSPGSTDTAMQRALWTGGHDARTAIDGSPPLPAGHPPRQAGRSRRHRGRRPLPGLRPCQAHHHAGPVRRRGRHAPVLVRHSPFLDPSRQETSQPCRRTTPSPCPGCPTSWEITEPGTFFFTSPTRTLLARGVLREVPDPGTRPAGPRRLGPARRTGLGSPRSRRGGRDPLPRRPSRAPAGARGRLLDEPAGRSSAAPERITGTFTGFGPVSDSRRLRRGVERALAKLTAGELQKIVLARTMDITMGAPVDVGRVLRNLVRRDPQAYGYAVDLPSSGDTARTLLGASPELLVSRSGRRITTNPLAGSAPRHPDPVVDRERARALLASDKDLREHALVIESIVEALRPYCRRLSVPAGPSPLSTASMWHLSTRITGVLDDPAVTSLELATVLHPTPPSAVRPRAPRARPSRRSSRSTAACTRAWSGGATRRATASGS